MPKLTSSETPTAPQKTNGPQAVAGSQTASGSQASTRSQALNLILLGPPGAGKGTQALAIAGRLGLRHISTGDLFRQHMQKRTPLGLRAKVQYDRGEYVPDHLVIAMVREELFLNNTETGTVLDGFPRTVTQAEALAEILAELGQQIGAAIALVSGTEEIVERAQGRRICPEGHTYHTVKRPPAVADRCDVDGLPLQQRVDDRPDTVRKRIATYNDRTKPLLEFYAGKDLLRSIDGSGSIEQVTGRIETVLSEVGLL